MPQNVLMLFIYKFYNFLVHNFLYVDFLSYFYPIHITQNCIVQCRICVFLSIYLLSKWKIFMTFGFRKINNTVSIIKRIHKFNLFCRQLEVKHINILFDSAFSYCFRYRNGANFNLQQREKKKNELNIIVIWPYIYVYALAILRYVLGDCCNFQFSI